MLYLTARNDKLAAKLMSQCMDVYTHRKTIGEAYICTGQEHIACPSDVDTHHVEQTRAQNDIHDYSTVPMGGRELDPSRKHEVHHEYDGAWPRQHRPIVQALRIMGY